VDKLNNLGPRITIQSRRTKNVPIEKVCSNMHSYIYREKFFWAIKTFRGGVGGVGLSKCDFNCNPHCIT